MIIEGQVKMHAGLWQTFIEACQSSACPVRLKHCSNIIKKNNCSKCQLQPDNQHISNQDAPSGPQRFTT
jgi:hypothetical protein